MTAQELKNSILQLAVQGKLIIDNGELKIEETGAQLLERIRAEKAKLVAEGKIKKSHADSGPLRGSLKNKKGMSVGLPNPCDNKNSIAEDEKPFDIPENWCWCRLGEIAETNIGLTYSPSDISENGIGVLRSNNIQDGKIVYDDIVKVKIEVPENKMCIPGDILICARNGSKRLVGKAAIIKEAGFSFGAFMAILRSICNEYLLYVINSLYFRNYLLPETSTTTINQITQDNLKKVPIPLPPLAEQKAIVAKIEELLPYIEKYDAAYTKLEEFNKKFPEDMQKSILQQAVQGKLVPQNKSDGNAKDLLAQIKAEKEKLIAEGKINGSPSRAKSRDFPPITEDEIPFDIPENWCWCRLGEISTYANTKEKISANFITPEMWTLDLEDIEKNTGRIIQKVLAKDRKIAGDKVRFEKGDILYSKLRPYLKKNLIAPSDGICSSEIVPFKLYGQINSEYILKVLICPYVDFAINSVTYGVKMPRVGTDTMINLPIPLPPLAEQKRIVAKIEELLPLCKKLER